MKKRIKQIPEIRLDAIVRETLTAMAKRRKKDGAWIDSERESAEETQIFKSVEALRTFLIAYREGSPNIGKMPLSDGEIEEDLSQIFVVVQKDGYFPSPYSFVKEKYDSVDFASSLLSFFIEVDEYLGDRMPEQLRNQLEEETERALTFLSETGLSQKGVCRWGATRIAEKLSRYTDVFFTSCAVAAIYRAMKFLGQRLEHSTREELQVRIRSGCAWILQRDIGEGFMYGDERLSKRGAQFSIHGLRALLELWEVLDEGSRTKIRNLLKRTTELVIKAIEEPLPSIFYDVPIEMGKGAYFEDRTTWAEALSMFCLGRARIPKKEIITDVYDSLLGMLLRMTLASKESRNNLWEREGYLVGSCIRAIEAITLYMKYGVPKKIEIWDIDFAETLRRALSDDEVVNLAMEKAFRILDERRMELVRKELERGT